LASTASVLVPVHRPSDTLAFRSIVEQKISAAESRWSLAPGGKKTGQEEPVFLYPGAGGEQQPEADLDRRRTMFLGAEGEGLRQPWN
jgi:hypothetical protein